MPGRKTISRLERHCWRGWEGQLPLDEASAKYVTCFPPAAGMDLEHIRQTWSGWNSAMRGRLARQIRRSMSGESE